MRRYLPPSFVTSYNADACRIISRALSAAARLVLQPAGPETSNSRVDTVPLLALSFFITLPSGGYQTVMTKIFNLAYLGSLLGS
jgi:hypothetical protein